MPAPRPSWRSWRRWLKTWQCQRLPSHGRCGSAWNFPGHVEGLIPSRRVPQNSFAFKSNDQKASNGVQQPTVGKGQSWENKDTSKQASVENSVSSPMPRAVPCGLLNPPVQKVKGYLTLIPYRHRRPGHWRVSRLKHPDKTVDIMDAFKQHAAKHVE